MPKSRIPYPDLLPPLSRRAPAIGLLLVASELWGNMCNLTARLTGRNVVVDNVNFHTEGEGTIELSAVERRGEINIRADGGPVELLPPK